MKAIFPVSLGNQRFSTEAVVTALNAINEDYEEITFIIADEIQLYNRARHVTDGTSLSELLNAFKFGHPLLEQRRNWLSRVQRKVRSPERFGQWHVIGFDDIGNKSFIRVMRNITISFHTLLEFRADVQNAALRFCRRRAKVDPPGEVTVALSEAYILEEIAAGIILHTYYEIEDDYYLGEQMLPMLRIFGGGYAVDPFALAGLPKQEKSWRFFEFSTLFGGQWRQCSLDA